MSRSTLIAAVFGLSLVAVGACKHAQPQPEVAAAPAPAPPPEEPVEAPPPESNQADVSIDKSVREMCELPNEHFAFNSDKLSPSASATLDALAECFTSGPAKGRSMNLVGHADPRGEEDYNFGLGERRAARVATYLESKGVAKVQLATSSRGELEASGTDESGWSKDRRVQVYLAD